MKAETVATIVVIVQACISAAGERTIYPTDDPLPPTSSREDEAEATAHMAKILARAQGQRECLPASDFPEGNWGPATNGFQVSVRFEKGSYAPGETPMAILLFRSLTNETFVYSPPRFLYPPDLEVRTLSGQEIPPNLPRPMIIHSGILCYVWPLTQHKQLENLKEAFNLTNGVYLVRVATEFTIQPKPTPEELQRFAEVDRLHETNWAELHRRFDSGELKGSAEVERAAREYFAMEDKKLQSLGGGLHPPPPKWFKVRSADARLTIEATSPAPQK